MATFSGSGKVFNVLGKVAFVNKWPLLLKATSDDDTPTPGYLYQEISALTYNSSPQSQIAFLEFMVHRLEKKSPHVKFKVLQVMKYVVIHGHEDFRNGLRRQSRGIYEATKFSGPPDPLHGGAPYLAVRKQAKELTEILFDEDRWSHSGMSYSSEHQPKKVMEGFGNTVNNNQQKTMQETIVEGFHQISDSFKEAQSKNITPMYRKLSGLASEETVETPSLFSEGSEVNSFQTESVGTYRPINLVESLQEEIPLEETQRENSLPLSDSLSLPQERVSVAQANSSGKESADSSDLSKRLESVAVPDWSQELQLVDGFLQSGKSISRDEISTFVKRSSILNCEKVLEILAMKVVEEDAGNQVKCLCGIEAVLRESLVQADHALPVLQQSLTSLKLSPNKILKAKASKILRQLELQGTHNNRDLPKSAHGEFSSILHNENKDSVDGLISGVPPHSSMGSDLFGGMNLRKPSDSDSPIKTWNVDNKRPMAAEDKNRGEQGIDQSTNVGKVATKETNLLDFNFHEREGNSSDLNNRIFKQSSLEDQLLENCKAQIYPDEGLSESRVHETQKGAEKDTSPICRVSPEESRLEAGRPAMDPLLSRRANFSDMVKSLNLSESTAVSSKPSAIPENKTSSTPLNTDSQILHNNSSSALNISEMFPQLAGSHLSGQSSVPLQLGKRKSDRFGFLEVEGEKKNGGAFDFVEDVMKSSQR